VGTIVVSGVLLGAMFAPLRTFQAFRAGSKARPLFDHNEAQYAALLELSVGELRERLGVPRAGLNVGRRRLHSTAPAGV